MFICAYVLISGKQIISKNLANKADCQHISNPPSPQLLIFSAISVFLCVICGWLLKTTLHLILGFRSVESKPSENVSSQLQNSLFDLSLSGLHFVFSEPI